MTTKTISMAVLLLGVTAIVSFQACSSDPSSSTSGSARGPRVLVITLDTTRWDRLGVSGRRRGDVTPSPNLDALAEEGTWFPEAYVSVPLTLPSHASMFTGLEPPRHGIRENEGFVLPPRRDRTFPTMAEVLKERGYATAAFLSAQPLAAGYGLSAGFDVYDDVGSSGGGHHHFNERPANETTDRALEWIADAGDGASFVWVHYFDPHAPYRAHDGAAGEVARTFGHRYDGEVAFMDRHVGRLLDAYRERGWWDETLVVVLADHGESLGDHDEATHGLLAYDTTVRVPFILKLPSGSPPAMPGIARSVDILPTVLDCVGAKKGDVDGTSLLEKRSGTVYSETVYPFRQYGWAALRCWREGSMKVIEGGGRVELYDVVADPGETNDLAGERPDEARRLTRRLRARLADLARRGPAVSVDTRTDVRGMAYTQVESSTVPVEPTEDENVRLPHPGDRMAVVAALDELRVALDGLDRPDVEAAQEAFATVQYLERRLASEDADSPAVLFWRGRALYLMASRGARLEFPDSGRLEMSTRALKCFDGVLAARSRDVRTRNMVLMTGLVRHELGVADALGALEAAANEQVALGLADGLTWALRARGYAAGGRREDALRAFRKAVELAPDRAAFREDLKRLEAEKD